MCIRDRDYGKWIQNSEGRPSFQARPDALNIPVHGVADTLRELIGVDYRFGEEVSNRVFGLLRRDVIERPTVEQVAAASGSAVVAAEGVLSEIVDLNENIYALDMESYGFYFACLNTNVCPPDFVCIKGVADHCNGEKDSKWHAPCSFLSAHFALEVVRRHRFSD